MIAIYKTNKKPATQLCEIYCIALLKDNILIESYKKMVNFQSGVMTF